MGALSIHTNGCVDDIYSITEETNRRYTSDVFRQESHVSPTGSWSPDAIEGVDDIYLMSEKTKTRHISDLARHQAST